MWVGCVGVYLNTLFTNVTDINVGTSYRGQQATDVLVLYMYFQMIFLPRKIY